MRCFNGLMRKSAICLLIVAILSTNFMYTVYADSESVDISKEATAANVEKVESLAQSLYDRNTFATQSGGYSNATPNKLPYSNTAVYPRTGLFSWDTESTSTPSNPKRKSWTYYNGIMMDAFLMIDDSSDDLSFLTKVNEFYDININSSGRVDNTNPANTYNKNGYSENELDSIPPTRALFDLIRGRSTNSDKYKKMIDYVYHVMEGYETVDGTDGNFKHKIGKDSWNTYQVALDGLYMAQPFFMEIANALDDVVLNEDDFPTANIKPTANKLYDEVISRMLWIGDNLYDEHTGLYNHAWGPKVTNGQPDVNGQFWLRAIGWYAAALADVIDMLPDRYAAQREQLVINAKKLFDGMIEGRKSDGTPYQDPETGMWYNVVNHGPELQGTASSNQLETSGSALIAYAMLRLYTNGYVEDKYGEAGLRAFNGVVTNEVYNNELHNVYISSGVETSPEGYLSKTYRTNEAKGVGPLMMAAAYANAAAVKYNTPTDPEWTEPEAKSGLVYDGNKQALVTAGTTEDGTIKYALGADETTEPGEDAWTTDVPSGKDAGTYNVWYKLEGDSRHNSVDPRCVTVQIARKTVTVTGITAKDKVYDGNTDATLDFRFVTIAGKNEVDDLFATATGTFSDASIGDNKTVTISDITLTGTSKDNYKLAEDGHTMTATASIKPHTHEWEYSADGSTLTATCKNTDGGHSGETSGSMTIFAPLHTAYGDGKNAAATISGSVEGISTPEIVYMQGDDTLDSEPVNAGSYTAIIKLGEAEAKVTYTIAPKRVKITDLAASDKTYDGTTTAEITGTPKLSEDRGTVGLLGAIRNILVTGGAVENGDEVYVEYGVAAFADANAGKDKDVTFSNFTLSGSSAPNYQLTGQPESVKADINKKDASVTAKNQIIKEGESIATGTDQAVLEGALEGHTLSSVSFDNVNNAQIRPYDAAIIDASNQDVTRNYNISYTNGNLTVQADPTPTPEPTTTPEPSITPDPSATPEPTPTLAPGDLAVDGTISVSGLETGDKVSFYQILKFSQDAVDTGGWIAAPGFEALTKDEIQKILSLGDYAPGESKESEAGIDETLAAKIADMAEQTSAKYPGISEVNGTASRENPEAGLYVALITPGKLGTIYNPIFVGADYTANNQSSNWKVNLNDSYEPASMAKKGVITLTKTASTADGNPDGVSAGDLVTFTVKTTIPEYGDDYTSAAFRVTDTLSAGLELQTGTINVYKDSAVSANLLAAADSYSDGKAYKRTTDTSGDDTFTVDFFTQYILGLDAAQDIVITYQAKVTTSAPASVNLEKNTVTVNYSNQPTDGSGNGTLRDETKHYTFDIDANILGDNSWKTTEVVKVGIGADGKELEEVVSLHEGQSVGALEGAEFKLYVPVTGGTHEFMDSEGNTVFTEPYTNSILTSGKVIVSDATGRLTIRGETLPGIRGLDLGTYYLVEEKAPTGYVKYSNAVKLEILAPDDADHWETKTYEEVRNGYTYTWDVKELKKYEVRINDVVTAEYTFLNEEDEASAIGSSSDTAVRGDTITGSESEGYIGRPGATENAGIGKIINTQGAELPSTGGPGTTLFYLIGSILTMVAGAGIVMKKRSQKAA